MDDRAQLDTLLAHEDWAAHSRLMTGYAYKLVWKRSWAIAEELAQAALERFYEGAWQRWDPSARTLRSFLLGLVFDEHSNWAQKKSTTAERLLPKKKEGKKQPRLPRRPTDADDSPEAIVARKERAGIVRSRLEERLSDDEDARKLYAMFLEGVDAPAEQAEHAGMDIERVRNARKRVFRHIEAIEDELDEEEG
jgi:DNA-directed RNA polymerase specialized sigma24 family protein